MSFRILRIMRRERERESEKEQDISHRTTLSNMENYDERDFSLLRGYSLVLQWYRPPRCCRYCTQGLASVVRRKRCRASPALGRANENENKKKEREKEKNVYSG